MNSKSIYAFVIFLLIASLSHADDGWKEISGNIVGPDSCGNPENFLKLFKLSISGKFTGVAQIEYLAEENETSFFNCPRQFLIEMKRLSTFERESVFNYFGIVNPPWEIAKVLKTLRIDEEVGEFIDSEFHDLMMAKEP